MASGGHTSISTGDGWRCTACGVAWDRDEDPGVCKPEVDPRQAELPLPATMMTQVGGSHYSRLAIQPTEFCQRNGLDFCVGSILKYLTRYRFKNGIEDLRKARHFVEIRESYAFYIKPIGGIELTMLEYVTRNNLIGEDAEALHRLEHYYGSAPDPVSRVAAARRLVEQIDVLIARTA